MKVFDSGMPNEPYWNSLFDIDLVVKWLRLDEIEGPVVEIGCGYGTFTVPIARESGFDLYAFDIDPLMIGTAGRNVRTAGLTNVKFFQRDVVADGTAMKSGSVAMVLLFNILHFEDRRVLLEEASRILMRNGVAAIVHWRKDIETPRGPEISSRPDDEIILDSIDGLDLDFRGNSRILKPYHWGMQLVKNVN